MKILRGLESIYRGLTDAGRLTVTASVILV